MRSAMVLLLGVVLLLPCSLLAKTDKADFSGTWTLDTAKSALGEGGQRRLATTVVVEQKGNNFLVIRKGKRQSGEDFEIQDTLTLDGKECKGGQPDRPKTTTVVWAADGQSLTISSKTTFERDGEQVEMTSTEIWKLSEKNAVLTIDYASQSPRGERKATYVYNKGKAAK